MKRLSIVIPALDEAANLARLLPDLTRAAPDAEVLVVDAVSRDGTADVVARNPGARLLTAARGRARQMNAGAAAAAGDALLFLHADTRLPEGAVGAIVSGGKGTATEKFAALEKAGVRTVRSLADLGETMAKALG